MKVCYEVPRIALALSIIASATDGAVIIQEVDYFFAGPALPEFQTRSLDFDGNGRNDITFAASGSNVTVSVPAGNRMTSHPQGGLDLEAHVNVVPPGTLIGATLPAPLMWWNNNPFETFISSCNLAICSGAFGELSLGVEFAIEQDLHYGWVFLDSYAGGGHITRLAYESDAGEPILVPIPEPGAVVLILVASVVSSRRRGLRGAAKSSMGSRVY
jgi:hypothetical protein